MKTLRSGDKGKDVEKLQRALKRRGFPPGAVDGIFGDGTEAAVRAFQASEGLLVDGIAGKRTLRALAVRGRVEPPDSFSLEALTAEVVATLFPGARQSAVETNLPHVKTALSRAGLTDKAISLMALATIRAETAGFEPISEFKSRFNSSPDGHPFDLYDNRQDLGNQGPPDGERYRGRGFIQLTGRFNYRLHGKAIGMDRQLERNPDLANDPGIAAALLASFIKSKETAIKQALLEGDLRQARRLVNGGSHGLRAFSTCYRKGLSLFPDS